MQAWLKMGALVAMGVVLVIACSGSEDEKLARAALADGCTLNTDCVEPLVCAFRRCHNECESSRDCPEGQRCLASDRPFHVCQLPEETACSYNSQCPVGLVCGKDGECRDECLSELDCVPPQVCVTGTCAERDELDEDGQLPENPNGPTLEGGSGIRCTFNSECTAPRICKSGACVFECLADRDCSAGSRCEGHLCTQPAPPRLDAGSGPECRYNSDCTDPLVCVAGACSPECRQDRDCVTGYACDAERCVPLSPVAPDASTTPDCVYSSECASPMVCSGGTCRLECLQSRDCAFGHACIGNLCVARSTASDAGSSAECVYTSDCAAGSVCKNGTCIPECVTDVDCPDGEACQSGQCVFTVPAGAPASYGEPCSLPSDCDVPLVCSRTGRCIYECFTSADCGPTHCCSAFHTCVTGTICEIPSTDAGTGTGGGACSGDLDCQDGVVCNGFERCVAGTCQGADKAACDDGNPCTIDSCDETAGTCSYAPAGPVDQDGDGHQHVSCGGDDCDDANPDVFPGHPELCDGVDNNCNGQTDEGVWSALPPVALPKQSGSTYPTTHGPPAGVRVASGDVYVVAPAYDTAGADSRLDAWRLDANLAVVEGPIPVVPSSDQGTWTTYHTLDPDITTNGTEIAVSAVHALISGSTYTDRAVLARGTSLTALGTITVSSVNRAVSGGYPLTSRAVTGMDTEHNGTDYVGTVIDRRSGTHRTYGVRIGTAVAQREVTDDPTDSVALVTSRWRQRSAMTLTPTTAVVAWMQPTSTWLRWVVMSRDLSTVLATPPGITEYTSWQHVGGVAFAGSTVAIALGHDGSVGNARVVRVDATTGAFESVTTVTNVDMSRPRIAGIGGGFLLALQDSTRVRFGWSAADDPDPFVMSDLDVGATHSGPEIVRIDDKNALLLWSDGTPRFTHLVCGTGS